MKRILFMLVTLGMAAAATAATNVLVNGSFDHPTDPLHGWKSVYDAPGESWYTNNHPYVSTERSGAGTDRRLVLKVVDQRKADFEGVKVDSLPIPFDPSARYTFSARARSTGPNCRILIEGYRWRPGIKPHADPDLLELRKCYKFKQLYFGAQEGGDMGGVGPAWKAARRTIPEGALSTLARQSYDKIEFLVIHLVAIGGRPGILEVDDVKLEKIP